MYTISEDNIEFILKDLQERGIETESLQLNLLDHICILVEENLEENGDFESFYYSAIKTFYKKELYEIEEATRNYSSHKNIFIMKKAMIISGACSAAGFIGGSLCKIMLYRITDFLLFLGFASFVLLFLPLLFIVLLKDFKSKKDLVIYSSGTLSLMLYFICMLMKCLDWPSSNMQLGLGRLESAWLIMWLVGLAVGSFVFIPSYLMAGIRKPETKNAAIITSVLLIAFIAVQFRLTNLRPLRQTNQHAFIQDQPVSVKTNQLATYTK